MEWRGRRKSNNVDDRRGQRSPSFGGGRGGGSGMLRFIPMVYRILGFKGTAILAACVGAYGLFTGNLSSMLGGGSMQASQSTNLPTQTIQQTAQEKEQVEFVSVVLADTEQTWTEIFKQQGQVYKEPRLVLFRNAVQSACGTGKSAMGPFYCPGDQQVYIDLSFFDQLSNRFKAPGDFAQAYVIAHEVGHHIQTITGTSRKVHEAKSKVSQVEANKLSVKQELQADCYAGVWAYHANTKRNMLESGDLEEGLRAATAIGDDTLQKQTQGHVSPDSFTHGSSEQRVKWFKIGIENGDVGLCDTFTRA